MPTRELFWHREAYRDGAAPKYCRIAGCRAAGQQTCALAKRQRIRARRLRLLLLSAHSLFSLSFSVCIATHRNGCFEKRLALCAARAARKLNINARRFANNWHLIRTWLLNEMAPGCRRRARSENHPVAGVSKLAQTYGEAA